MNPRKRLALGLTLLALISFSGVVEAEIGTIDNVPAATLLLPYFEVDLASGDGVTTLFSIKNASSAATLAHVTFWSDESIPCLDFDVYLTGYDVQTVNIRDVFNGFLPVTADDPRDTLDTISPQGDCSEDTAFPNCAGRLPLPSPALNSTLINHFRACHTGTLSPVFGLCAAAYYGDDIARGYVTVDAVNECSLLFPNSPGYFVDGGLGVASNDNVLWGDYFYVDPANNFAQGETLVHIEACNSPSVGQGADDCPLVTGDYTFYGRYVAGTAIDNREPLPTTFGTDFINGGAFIGATDLIVWRDSKTTPTGANGPHSCSGNVAWFPLSQTDVVGFDEEENCTDLCFQGDIVSPPTGGTDTCIPLEAQRIGLAGGVIPPGGTPISPLPTFGWLFLNLNTSTAGVGGIFGDTAQAWVTTVMSASGLFSVGFDAIAFDTALDTNPTSGFILIP